jgi:hypothetical protein
MARALRVVERLRLRAPSEALVRRAVARLEDALRTASLPDHGARMVVVRRLPLGRIAEAASAQRLALAVEARIASLGAGLVHADEPSAAHADAVWFRDPLEAHCLAALRAAAGSPLDAWYWPLALPALKPSGAKWPVLRALAFSVASLAEAPAALPHWTATLVLAGHAGRLLAALHPGDGAALLDSAGLEWDRSAGRAGAGADRRASGGPWAGTERAEHQAGDAGPGGGVPGIRVGLPDGTSALERGPWTVTDAIDSAHLGARTCERALGENAEREDDRHLFVRAMLRRAGARTVAAPALSLSRVDADRTVPPLAGAVANQGAAAQARGRERSSEPTREAAVLRDVDAGSGLRPGVTLGARSPEAAAEAGACSTRQDEREVRAVCSSRTAEIDSGPAERIDRGSRPGQPTRAGGLLFLVPVLERVGFARWWSARREAHSGGPDWIAGAIFARLLNRLHVESDDPTWGVVLGGGRGNGPPPLPTLGRAAAQARPSGTGRVPGGPGLGPPRASALADAWLHACRHLLRRRVQIGLGSLVLRPARLALTPTHADVFFALDAVDVRVRRAGLDIDPGWVPWLGRVLAFHYGNEGWA